MTRQEKNALIKKLSPSIFWDTAIEKLDYWHNKRTIIERIADYGRDSDEKILYQLYSKNTIKSILKKADYLNSRTITYFAFKLKLPEKRFKCYGKKLPHRL